MMLLSDPGAENGVLPERLLAGFCGRKKTRRGGDGRPCRFVRRSSEPGVRIVDWPVLRVEDGSADAVAGRFTSICGEEDNRSTGKQKNELS